MVCVCGKQVRRNSKFELVSCGWCESQYHAPCVGYDDIDDPDDIFVCPNCKAELDQASDSGSDANNDWCEECEMGGLLVCCDTCRRAFHPKCIGITSLPDDGEWSCDYCERGEDGELPVEEVVWDPLTENQEDAVDAASGDEEGHSENMDPQDEVQSVGSNEQSDGDDDDDDEEEREDDDEGSEDYSIISHDDECNVCSDGGELLCCASCPKVFHGDCLDIDTPMEDVPDNWKCPECAEKSVVWPLSCQLL